MSDPRTRKIQEVLQRQMEQVQQLRAEKRLPRLPCTQTISDMVRFMDEHSNVDFLLKGFTKPSDNPFHEKGRCNLL